VSEFFGKLNALNLTNKDLGAAGTVTPASSAILAAF
jgi:hypothetical protein